MSVNAGSSSLKFQVFKMPEEEVLAQGNVERIGLNDSIFGMKANGEKIEEILDIKDHAVAVKKLMEALIELQHQLLAHQILQVIVLQYQR